MTRSEGLPSSEALEEVRRLAGSSAVVLGAARLEGGQHADTWRVDTENPATSVVVRQFPLDDPAPLREQRVLRALDGLGGLAPVPLGGDLNGRWSKYPTSLISWLDGQPDITPTDPRGWARELGRALAAVHTVPTERLAELPSVFDRGGRLSGDIGRPAGGGSPVSLVRGCGVAGGAHPLRLLVGQRRLAGRKADGHRRLVGRVTRSTRLRPGLVPTRSRPPVRRADCRRLSCGL